MVHESSLETLFQIAKVLEVGEEEVLVYPSKM